MTNPFDSSGWHTKAINYASKSYRSPNFTAGNKGRDATVLHITDGTDSRGHLTNPKTQVSSHFLNREEGMYQLVSIHDSSWANGLTYNKGRWIDPAGNVVKPPWPDLKAGISPNFTTITIENETRRGVPISAKQYRQMIELLHDLGVVYPQFRNYVVGRTLIGHRDIAPIHRAHCPGPLFDFAQIARDAHGAAAPQPASARYRIKNGIDYAQVRIDRSIQAAEARYANGLSIRLWPNSEVDIDDITNGWGHLADGRGFVSMTLLRSIATESLSFVHAPRISKQQFVQILVDGRSPAAADGPLMYRAIASVGVDPAVALAFFKHESGFGRYGLCATHDLKNMGNVRTAYNKMRGREIVISGRGNFFKFDSWEVGALDWAEHMRYRYGDENGLTCVETAVPIYAPTADNNKPQVYIQAVRDAVALWEKG